MNYGQGLRYGKYAIITVVSQGLTQNLPERDYEEKAKEETDSVLARWLEFEDHVIHLKHNHAYFVETKDPVTQQEILEVNFDGYYKGSTLNRDLSSFFGLSNAWIEAAVKPWKESVMSAVLRITKESGSIVFSRQELIEKELSTIVAAVGSTGKTPQQTLSRVLQELRSEGVISFENAGLYKLVQVK